MPTATSVDVLIMGGGIGGLTTAIACQQAGFSSLILERASDFSEVGAGIWIAPNAMQIFDRLEIISGLTELGYPIDQIHLSSTYSGELQVMNFQRYKFNILAIHRARLQKYLAQCIEQDQILFGRQVIHIEQESEEVTVQLASGETFRAKILVAADGLHSQVRKLIFKNDKTQYSGSSSFRGIVKLNPHSNHMDHTSYEIWAPGCKFGYSFISTSEQYWYLCFKAKAHTYLKSNEMHSFAKKLVAKYFLAQIDLIDQTAPGQIIQTDLSDLSPLPYWSDKRIALLGDAAHATTPHLGQGAAQAIEDAMALSLALKKYGLNEQALTRYLIRHQKAEYLVRKARAYGNMSESSSPFFQIIRDMAIRNTPQFIMDKMSDKIFIPVIQ
ncbi:FAD-binding protein [Legionella israelensis]|uniref:FAD-dependent monooxygenase n=1 Tax=Legionella israelensis TaxID=454 RepID=UPI001180A1E5|nr:FAD-dependent monooxygenase [Legionella israelensis]QDP72321.1 FAD-binding protein [Legionella israelensis]